jgi:hypothetical protein
MVKEMCVCLNAAEAPSLPGAYAMAIELADTAVVMLSGSLPIALPAAAFAPHAARQISALAC